MEEQKKKKVWLWIKENPVTVGVSVVSFALTVAEGYYLLNSRKCIGNLTKENQSLRDENADLRGQIRATEKENRRLGREIENSYYQLGKKSMIK